jgi:type IV secretory pathway TraG/TraD family ATPase VirD4
MLSYLLPMLDYDRRWREERAPKDPELPPAGWLPGCIKVLNPFDRRGAAWDMAADVTAPATAQQIAAILIPVEKNSSQPFFANAARHLLYGVLLAFIGLAPGQWTFRDVCLALRSEEWLRDILARSEHTEHLVAMYLNEGDTLNSVKATIATKMMPYEVVAAAWSRTASKVRLRDFLDPGRERLVLVLGNDESNRDAVDAINRVLLRRLSELIIAQPESEERRTWIFFDEVREAGRLDGLGSLLLRGRSKGACVVLGFQDIDGLKDVYGEHQAQELVGQCAYKAILRLESPTTAEWASRHFGARERVVRRQSQSVTMGQGFGTQSGLNEQLEKTEIVLPIQLLRIPPPLQGRLTGYYLTPVAHYENTVAFGSLLQGRAPDVAFAPRDEADQYLEPWTTDDLDRLRLFAPPPEHSRTERPPTRGMDVNVLGGVS